MGQGQLDHGFEYGPTAGIIHRNLRQPQTISSIVGDLLEWRTPGSGLSTGLLGMMSLICIISVNSMQQILNLLANLIVCVFLADAKLFASE